MSDEELLNKYKSYKKKRNIIIIIISLLLALSILIVGNFPKNNENVPKTIETSKEEAEKDQISPILELKVETDEIEVNSVIDYKNYIKTAIDNVDGDITDNVEFNKIDTSQIGTFDIVYYVFDSSNNMTQKILQMTIIKKEEQVVEDIPKKEEQNTKPTKPVIDNSKIETKEPIIKYFMFKDGYTMGNVVEVCAEELKKSNRAGRCLPITDDNGIYLGMKLELN